MSAEFIALASASSEAEWLRNLMFEIPLLPKPISPVAIHADCMMTLGRAYSQVYNGKSHHIAWLKDKDKKTLVQDENINNRWRKYFDELYNGEQWNFVGDTTITLLYKKEIYAKNTKNKGGRGLEENKVKESSWARWYTYWYGDA